MKDQVLKELRNLTKHENLAITNRGNAAILLAILQSTGPVLAPREGGWLSYETLAKSLGRKFIHIETTAAIINQEDLKTKLKEAGEGALFIYHSNAAYGVAQDTKQIYYLCHEAKVKVEWMSVAVLELLCVMVIMLIFVLAVLETGN